MKKTLLTAVAALTFLTMGRGVCAEGGIEINRPLFAKIAREWRGVMVIADMLRDRGYVINLDQIKPFLERYGEKMSDLIKRAFELERKKTSLKKEVIKLDAETNSLILDAEATLNNAGIRKIK